MKIERGDGINRTEIQHTFNLTETDSQTAWMFIMDYANRQSLTNCAQSYIVNEMNHQGFVSTALFADIFQCSTIEANNFIQNFQQQRQQHSK